jgi:hypothetical protein
VIRIAALTERVAGRSRFGRFIADPLHRDRGGAGVVEAAAHVQSSTVGPAVWVVR